MGGCGDLREGEGSVSEGLFGIAQWVETVFELTDGQVIALDGKLHGAATTGALARTRSIG